MAGTRITGRQVKDESLTGDDIATGSIPETDLVDYSLETLRDTNIVNPVTDEVIAYDGVEWYNQENYGRAAIFPILFTYKGNVSNGHYFGYTELIDGLNSPIPIQGNGILRTLTFTNSRDNASYDLLLRKNSPTATPFVTISKTNVRTFVFNKTDDPAIEETFVIGDLIYIQHISTGTVPQDAGITLNFSAVA